MANRFSSLSYRLRHGRPGGGTHQRSQRCCVYSIHSVCTGQVLRQAGSVRPRGLNPVRASSAGDTHPLAGQLQCFSPRVSGRVRCSGLAYAATSPAEQGWSACVGKCTVHSTCWRRARWRRVRDTVTTNCAHMGTSPTVTSVCTRVGEPQALIAMGAHACRARCVACMM